jgi:hypothetical protein
MELPRTLVGFSSTDLHSYKAMQAWKANHNIDFNFTDCKLNYAINSNNEAYVKRKVREQIEEAEIYIMLIGNDTKRRHKYIGWEAEIALERNCTIIGVNLDGSKKMKPETCPTIIQNIGAIFVPFSPEIVAHAIENYRMRNEKIAYHYDERTYMQFGRSMAETV